MQGDELYQNYVSEYRRAHDLDRQNAKNALASAHWRRIAEDWRRIASAKSATVARVRLLSDKWAKVVATTEPHDAIADQYLLILAELNGELAEALAGPNDGEVNETIDDRLDGEVPDD